MPSGARGNLGIEPVRYRIWRESNKKLHIACIIVMISGYGQRR